MTKYREFSKVNKMFFYGEYYFINRGQIILQFFQQSTFEYVPVRADWKLPGRESVRGIRVIDPEYIPGLALHWRSPIAAILIMVLIRVR